MKLNKKGFFYLTDDAQSLTGQMDRNQPCLKFWADSRTKDLSTTNDLLGKRVFRTFSETLFTLHLKSLNMYGQFQ